MLLDKGKWKGKRIIGRKWVKEATSKQIETGKNNNDWAYGYGYQFWMNPPGGFRADGAYGQYCIVFPEKDTVLVITAESFDKQETMRLVWNELLPEIRENEPIEPNEKQFKRLQKKLKTLRLDPPKYATNFPFAKIISGKVFVLEDNELNVKAVSFEFSRNECLFTIKNKNNEERVIKCGINRWVMENNMKPGPKTLFSDLRIDFKSVLAASATWRDENTLLITFRFPESTHTDTIMCTFIGEKLTLSFRSSIAASGKEGPENPARHNRNYENMIQCYLLSA